MPHASICQDCGRITSRTTNGRCDTCAPHHERQRTTTRAATEPWRRLYNTNEWRNISRKVKKRDGHQCRVTGCTETTGLTVHHTRRLADLWHDTNGEWATFVRTATDPAALVTTCQHHNRQLDVELRKAAA